MRVDVRTVLARDVLETLRQRFGGAVTAASVRMSVRMREAPGARQPIGVFDADGGELVAGAVRRLRNGQPRRLPVGAS
ncbi:MAG: hypothetical protein IT332_00115 [Ardenticatenales bacterium]|nr:hypothetical protein [Ardenticatenales bacterium]